MPTAARCCTEPGRPNDLSGTRRALGRRRARGTCAALRADRAYRRLLPAPETHHWSAAYACLGTAQPRSGAAHLPGGERRRQAAGQAVQPGIPADGRHRLSAPGDGRGADRRPPGHRTTPAAARFWPMSIRTASVTKSARPAASRPCRRPSAMRSTACSATRRSAPSCQSRCWTPTRHEAPRTGTDGGLSDDDLCRHYAELYRPTPNSASTMPLPYRLLNPEGRSPVVLVCEHASRHIPLELQRLGLDQAAAEEHIAWGYRRPGAGRRAFPGGSTRHCWRPATAPADRPEPTAEAPTAFRRTARSTRFPATASCPRRCAAIARIACSIRSTSA